MARKTVAFTNEEHSKNSKIRNRTEARQVKARENYRQL